MVNDRSASAQMKKSNRAEEWLKNAVKDKHVRLIPFSEISKVKYNVAKGGSGTIHLGAWRNMHVAIKEQHNTNDLIKELKMHKQVHDSNYIVKFFGITKHPLTHDTCIVMQFAENGCLQDYLETQNVSITWLTKYRLAWEIASGLDFIHRESIFHTDLHSRNILIDTDGKALITDFGLSKSVNKTIYTTKAGLFGVVPYVAPERMQNPTINYNPKCDIYSLGVILWELSSCVIPFEAQLQDVMLAVNIINGVREKTVPGTAVEYEMLYRRCWDGLPQNRPQMDIVLSELVELLASEQINPRPAAPRPRSPRPARPLSSDSMVAPSSLFPYDNDTALQSSPENTHHMRPGVLQSFGQGMAPLVSPGAPPVRIRQDRSGARVSFLGEPVARESQGSSPNKTNGTINSHAKPSQPFNKNNKGPLANGQISHLPSGLDSPTILEVVPNGAGKVMEVNPVDEASNSRDQERHHEEKNGDASQLPVASGVNMLPAPPSAPLADAEPSGLQLLPPLPSFNALSFSPNASPSRDGLPSSAALALSKGVPMNDVLSKLKNPVRNISTISPPPHGAPPPPPGGVAGHSNFPRIISPPSSKPWTVSPPKMRNNQVPPASKTISPPTGPPPSGSRTTPSPSLGPIPKPPPGPPPSASRSPTPIENGPASRTSAWSPVAHINYTPSTTYNPGMGKTSGAIESMQPPASSGSAASDTTTRPTPARNIPMGFPVVVTPLSPPHRIKKHTLVASEQQQHQQYQQYQQQYQQSSFGSSPPETLHASEGSLPTGSPTGSPSSTNSTAPSSVGTSPTANRRDFRPISFLTQAKPLGQTDLATRADQQLQESAPRKNSAGTESSNTNNNNNNNNGYVPNPNNNIVPPSQLYNMQPSRVQSPDLIRHNNHRHSRILGSPSLGPAQSPTPDHKNNRIIHSPHLSPANNRPGSPAFALPPSSGASARGGAGFSTIEGPIWARDPKSTVGKRVCTEDDLLVQAMRQMSTDPNNNSNRPQMYPSKESSTSTTTTGTSLSTSPSNTQVSALSSSTTSTTAAAAGAGVAPKPRVPQANFYSLVDPYKNLNHDEPTDFFTAVTQSDLGTIERMLKLFPNLIHDSNGFWPHPTPILVAARSRNALETMKVLVQYGAALDRGDHNGTTVLHFVCEQYSDPVEAIQFLTRAGADCNSRDAKKRTPLMVLLQNNHISSTRVLMDSLRCLFKFGAQTKVMDHHDQRTPLHYAILYSKEPAPVMELLLKKGSEVNARDSKKSTPLHLVLERMDNEEIVQMLLLYGADPGLRNEKKKNALAVAAENLRVMSAWFLLENDLLSSAPESIKKANELCSKAEGPDKSAKPLFKNTLSDWQGKEGKQRRIQLAQDVVLRVQRTPDMKTIDQTQVALEFLGTVGQPIHLNSIAGGMSGGGAGAGAGAGSSAGGGTGQGQGQGQGVGVSSSNGNGVGAGFGTGSGVQCNVSPTTSSHSLR
ncbi:hypothetical protein EDD11_009466 [Mortierella claussenii]|nr:hypothetical protein EDD11_009466 [Mortierella claussenii]